MEKLNEQEDSQETRKWVRLHSLPGPVYADMVKAALEEQHIPCLVTKDFLSSAYGAQGTGSGGLETHLFVPEDRLEESKSVLNQMLNHI
ncbi:MAG: putative signal transducing protein [bacterium]